MAEDTVAKNIRQESKRIRRVCRGVEKKKCRNNKTVSMAGSQTECEGRVQIKRRIEELEVSQSDFTVFFTPPSFPLFTVSAKIFCQKVMETPL